MKIHIQKIKIFLVFLVFFTGCSTSILKENSYEIQKEETTTTTVPPPAQIPTNPTDGGLTEINSVQVALLNPRIYKPPTINKGLWVRIEGWTDYWNDYYIGFNYRWIGYDLPINLNSLITADSVWGKNWYNYNYVHYSGFYSTEKYGYNRYSFNYGTRITTWQQLEAYNTKNLNDNQNAESNLMWSNYNNWYNGYIGNGYYNTGFTADYFLSSIIIIIKNDPNVIYNDEGYIAPRVVKISNDEYLMWVTKVVKKYADDEYGILNGLYSYEYITECYRSRNGKSDWTNITDAKYLAVFQPSYTSSNEDDGGIIISDIVKTSDSSYNAYYLSTKNNVTFSDANIYSAYTSSSNPDNFIRGTNNLFQVIGKSTSGFDSYNIGTCSVTKIGDNFKMWYTGEETKRSSIGYATSSDGVLYWSKATSGHVFKGTKTKFDDFRVTDPYVLYDEGVYKMYYSGYDGLNYRLGLAYSSDGKSFSYYDQSYKPLALDNSSSAVGDIRYPSVIMDKDDNGNKIYRIYYSKRDNASSPWKIYSAETQAYK